MPRVLVVQHLTGDGPAYLAHWLAGRGVAYDVVDSEAGDTVPESLAGYDALALLGGEMSANDDLPALRRAEDLVRQAVQLGVPTLGHCLGGQLMARALGGGVETSPAPEIGWHAMQVLPCAEAAAWFGPASEHTVFQWHYEAFVPPAAGSTLATSTACPHQAWSLGPHLALQFHLELDLPKLHSWLQDEGERYRAAAARYPSVQSRADMSAGARLHMAGHRALADRVYARWLAGAAGR